MPPGTGSSATYYSSRRRGVGTRPGTSRVPSRGSPARSHRTRQRNGTPRRWAHERVGHTCRCRRRRSTPFSGRGRTWRGRRVSRGWPSIATRTACGKYKTRTRRRARPGARSIGESHPLTRKIFASFLKCFDEQLDWSLDDLPRPYLEYRAKLLGD